MQIHGQHSYPKTFYSKETLMNTVIVPASQGSSFPMINISENEREREIDYFKRKKIP